jgi:hypothetical protein
MTVDWLEHVDLPDGQAQDLLRRFPYERAAMVMRAREHDMALTQTLLEEGGSRARVLRTTATGFADACLRAALWDSSKDECPLPHLLKHELTGESIDGSQIGMASNPTVDKLRLRAAANYNTWKDEAYPAPKKSGRTGRQPAHSKTPAASETDESGSSDSGPRDSP